MPDGAGYARATRGFANNPCAPQMAAAPHHGLTGRMPGRAQSGRHVFDFDMLGLAPALADALARSGFTEPTPIQNQAIPLAMDGHDILGLAQTGTG